MSELIVAHRYAKSLLDFAVEKKVVEVVYQDMLSFKETCQGSFKVIERYETPTGGRRELTFQCKK
jgi:F0F1-type ATP synthase delta subunit